ncbi:uncharacterized protein LOC125495535 [Beta vulgaris subsp. vulgaris]|uniref:uncharacterized protein LOC125495535 n=1 Tax=Beta vulgaris subsp. vulgaris TaxID=3555 RepID=UPI002037082F|nr:uncharacterized protein LOC125495535 [Beta vulgaris subsp. vulgaris]
MIYGSNSRPLGSSPTQWCAPPSEVIKLNADASISNDGWVGLGVVARDPSVQVIFAAVRRCRAYWPSEVAECKAVHMALRLTISHGLSHVIFESNLQVVSSKLSKAALYFSDLDPIFGNVLSMCNTFISIRFSHVKRDGNTVAHNLARVVPFVVEQCWERHSPSDVAPYVFMDSLSLD